MTVLSRQQCRQAVSDGETLDQQQIQSFLSELNNSWKHNKNKNSISHGFDFNNYYETLSFVNAVAEIAHQQNHHPEMTISYNHCHITYTTHSINGLSLSDFICAARINEITI